MSEAFDYTQLNEIVLFKGDGDLIELKRNGRYIDLIKEKEIKKRYYRYDLKEKKFERVNFYKTKPTTYTEVKVRNITSWFTNCQMITKDLHFGRLIVFAKFNRRFDKYRSPVRFIEQLGHKIILAIEQWEALGIKLEPVEKFFGEHLEKVWIGGDYRDLRKYVFTLDEDITQGYNPWLWFWDYVDVLPGDLNKNLLDYIKKTYKILTRDELRNLRDRYNDGEYKIEQILKKIGRDPEFAGVFHYTTSYRYRGNGNPTRWAFGSSHESITVRNNLIAAIKNYHLDPISLARWLKKQQNVEKNDVGYLFGSGHHYNDYLECELELCDGLYSKMVKYPSNFRTEFHKKQEEFSIKKAEVDEQTFKQIAKDNKDYEYKDKKYIVKIPEATKEIHEEALVLDHCVRTYIPRVIEGKTLIAFLRNKNYPDQPLVTLEIKKGALTQAYGKNDSKPSREELKFLKKYIQKKDLQAGCWKTALS